MVPRIYESIEKPHPTGFLLGTYLPKITENIYSPEFIYRRYRALNLANRHFGLK